MAINFVTKVGEGGEAGEGGTRRPSPAPDGPLNVRPHPRPPPPPQDDERLLQDIQRFYTTQIEELPSNVADLL